MPVGLQQWHSVFGTISPNFDQDAEAHAPEQLLLRRVDCDLQPSSFVKFTLVTFTWQTGGRVEGAFVVIEVETMVLFVDSSVVAAVVNSVVVAMVVVRSAENNLIVENWTKVWHMTYMISNESTENIYRSKKSDFNIMMVHVIRK